MQDALSREKYLLILGNCPRTDPALQSEFFDTMANRSADRVILSPLPAKGLHEEIERLRARNIPVVFVNNYLSDYKIPFAVTDNRWGAYQLVRHVLDSGHERILFMGRTPEVAIFADRYAGYCDALTEAGAKVSRKDVFWYNQLQEKYLSALYDRLNGRNKPDAIFFDSLLTSGDVIDMIYDSLHLRHPEDILLCGFDQPMGLFLKKSFRETILAPLPSVRQDAERMGALAAELVLHGTVDGQQATSALVRPFLSWKMEEPLEFF